VNAQETPSLATDRLAAITRAALEAGRSLTVGDQSVGNAAEQIAAQADRKQRRARLEELERLTGRAASAAAGTGGAAAAGAGDPSGLGVVLKERASLELRLQKEQEQTRSLEKTLQDERSTHNQAKERLTLQQGRIKELQTERGRLLEDVSRLEADVRRQASETEQARLRFEKLQASRGELSDQSMKHSEQIETLKAENERLRAELETTRKQRDSQVQEAQTEVAGAKARTEDVALRELWTRMSAQLPDVFAETHVPTRETFENVCDTYIELLRTYRVLERHVHQLLKDLRQVGEQSDKLNHFYILFTKNPGLFDTLGDFLVTGRRRGNTMNLLRAHQAWARAFATGLYKTIVRSPVLISEELNPKDWPLKTGFTITEEAAIGKYFKETAQKTVPEKLGTKFRKHAADMAYEDYDDLMKRR
jgi:hypothetical protein